MKCTIPEISWHNREPVLSVDIHPISNDVYKLASGGGDSHILIWNMCFCENGSVKQEVVSDLTRHQRSVNTVRWSSSGQYLASADDDANIIVWQLKTDNIPLLEGNNDDKETWIVYKVLRGHKEDIYDLCWSVDNMKLLSGSIDNTSIIWDLAKGKMDHIMTDHKGFVQGVAWDPKNQILATISTDRLCRIFDITGKQVRARIHKGKLPLPTNHSLCDKESKFFHDDTFKSFFRRLEFSPDGSLLIVPSGYFQADDSKNAINCTLVFTLDNWAEPAAVLPLDGQSSTTVRCCPLLFHQREDGPEPLIKLPYRMIFAIGTDHDIILYDTQQPKPFARFHEIHYTRITDLTWSPNGLLLIASSTDGFCTLITFEPDELGKVYIKEESDEEVLEKDENVDITNEKEDVKKRPSFIQQWVSNTPKKAKMEMEKRDDEVIEIDDDNEEPKRLSKEIRKEINKLLPRRITPKRVEENGKFTNSEAKPIEVRRKPRLIETKEVIPRRIVPTKIEKNSEEVDRNMKINENKKSGTELIVLVETSKELEIKRQESNNESAEIKNVDPIKLESKNSSDNKFEDSNQEKIFPKIKLGGLIAKPNATSTKTNTTPTKTNKTPAKTDTTPAKTNTTPAKTNMLSAKMYTTSAKTNTTSAKTNITPAKTNTTPAKPNTTLTKKNPLLEFLKRSNEKKKIKPVLKETEKVDLTLDEDEARDGFDKGVVSKDKSSKVDETPVLEEEHTEDFCLQLEDTRDDQRAKKNESNEMDVDKFVDEKKEVNRIQEIMDESCSPKENKIDKIEDNVTQKKPRRVPFITLTSPKGKKKPVPKNSKID